MTDTSLTLIISTFTILCVFLIFDNHSTTIFQQIKIIKFNADTAKKFSQISNEKHPKTATKLRPKQQTHSNTAKYNKLKTLTQQGHWANFKYNGFGHEFTRNDEVLIINDQLSARYGRPFPWKEWKDQNYTGDWVGPKNLTVPTVSKQQIQSVIKSSRKSPIIAISGSSVARQIFTTIILYLQDKKCCFTTPIHLINGHKAVDSALLHRNFNQKISGFDVRYYFSVAFKFFDRGGEAPGTSAFLVPLLASDVNELQVYIISDHLLWILGTYLNPDPLTHECPDVSQKFKALITSPLEHFIKNVPRYLQKYPKLLIIFLPTNYVERGCRDLWWEWIDKYNSLLETAANLVNHERLIYMSSAVDMQQGPETGLPLSVDGTHLNWRGGGIKNIKYNRREQKNLPVVPAHQAMLDVLFGYVVGVKGLQIEEGEI